MTKVVQVEAWKEDSRSTLDERQSVRVSFDIQAYRSRHQSWAARVGRGGEKGLLRLADIGSQEPRASLRLSRPTSCTLCNGSFFGQAYNFIAHELFETPLDFDAVIIWNRTRDAENTCFVPEPSEALASAVEVQADALQRLHEGLKAIHATCAFIPMCNCCPSNGMVRVRRERRLVHRGCKSHPGTGS